jgi:hypothetical protein
MSTRSNPSKSALEDLVVEKKAKPILLMLSDEQAEGYGNTINGVSTNREQGATVVYKLYRRRWLGLGEYM